MTLTTILVVLYKGDMKRGRSELIKDKKEGVLEREGERAYKRKRERVNE